MGGVISGTAKSVKDFPTGYMWGKFGFAEADISENCHILEFNPNRSIVECHVYSKNNWMAPTTMYGKIVATIITNNDHPTFNNFYVDGVNRRWWECAVTVEIMDDEDMNVKWHYIGQALKGETMILPIRDIAYYEREYMKLELREPDNIDKIFLGKTRREISEWCESVLKGVIKAEDELREKGVDCTRLFPSYSVAAAEARERWDKIDKTQNPFELLEYDSKSDTFLFKLNIRTAIIEQVFYVPREFFTDYEGTLKKYIKDVCARERATTFDQMMKHVDAVNMCKERLAVLNGVINEYN